MASRESIAIRNEAALALLNASAAQVSKRVGVAPPDIPSDYRDASELPTMQLEALAAWTDRLAAQPSPRSKPAASGGVKEPGNDKTENP